MLKTAIVTRRVANMVAGVHRGDMAAMSEAEVKPRMGAMRSCGMEIIEGKQPFHAIQPPMTTAEINVILTPHSEYRASGPEKINRE